VRTVGQDGRDAERQHGDDGQSKTREFSHRERSS
jgi:hypothetical protein